MAAPPDPRVDNLLDLFASVCREGRWAGVAAERPDRNGEGGIDALYRGAGGDVLAIEHTLIEPFEGNQADLACLERRFASLETEAALLTPGVAASVDLAREAFAPGRDEAFREALRDWLSDQLSNVPIGDDFSSSVCRSRSGVPFELRIRR